MEKLAVENHDYSLNIMIYMRVSACECVWVRVCVCVSVICPMDTRWVMMRAMLVYWQKNIKWRLHFITAKEHIPNAFAMPYYLSDVWVSVYLLKNLVSRWWRIFSSSFMTFEWPSENQCKSGWTFFWGGTNFLAHPNSHLHTTPLNMIRIPIKPKEFPSIITQTK